MTFYDALGYPTPTDQPCTYSPGHRVTTKKAEETQTDTAASYEKNSTDPVTSSYDISSNDTLRDYLTHLNRRGRIWKFLPNIRAVYVCNSISFGACHPGSDIDLLIITERDMLRRAKRRASIILTLTGHKRRKHTDSHNKRCLSFRLDESACTISNQRLINGDSYLDHRLYHLIPRYSENTKDKEKIRKDNQWLSLYRTKRKPQQHIFLPLTHITGSTMIKKLRSRYNRSIIGRVTQDIIERLWKKHIRTTARQPEHKRTHHGVIATHTCVKTYHDKRTALHQKYQKYQKTYHTTKHPQHP